MYTYFFCATANIVSLCNQLVRTNCERHKACQQIHLLLTNPPFKSDHNVLRAQKEAKGNLRDITNGLPELHLTTQPTGLPIKGRNMTLASTDQQMSSVAGIIESIGSKLEVKVKHLV